jgi:hypothetical protein
MDYGFQILNICQNRGDIRLLAENYSNFCKDLCPIDCMNEEYMMIETNRNERIDGLISISLSWDESKS